MSVLRREISTSPEQRKYSESKVQIDFEMKKLNKSTLNFEQKKFEHDKKIIDLLSLPSKV